MPAFVMSAVMMMVIPMPAMVLDLMLAANITLAVVILLASILLKDNMELSVFPSLLLVTTLMRLSLNVASTRLILLNGYAGKVIQTFGHFVVGGSVVVGLVVFLILIVIQFVVITNGSGRVAEVAARFTLDAMPGRQMAIDADVAAGLIDQEQARALRKRIAKEADFYGAMDGAAKFVKGDAIAAILIVAVNLVGGFAIGMGSHHLPFGQAISTYSLLSVGDGLVAQIPALLISIATGLLVTRVGDDGSLGTEVASQLLARRDALRAAAVVVGLLGLLPGLPKVPFLGLAVALFVASSRPQQDGSRPDAKLAERAVATNPDDPQALLTEIRVDPLELELGHGILDLIDTSGGGDLLPRVKALRRQIALELGFIMPMIRTRDDLSMSPEAYRILLHGVEVGRGVAPRDQVLALPADSGSTLRALGGTETVEPVFGLQAFWIPDAARAQAAAAGATVVDRSSAIVTHLAEIVRRNAADLLSRQDVQAMIEGLRYEEPLLAQEVGSDLLPVSTLQGVLRGLLAEQVPVRDLSRIVDTVATRSLQTRVLDHLVAAARVAVGGAIVAKLAPEGTLAVITLDPAFEASLLADLREIDGETRLVVDPARVRSLRTDLEAALASPADGTPAVICTQALRRPLRYLLEASGLPTPVLAYPELPAHARLVTKGVIGHAHAAV
ncbi:MAG: FHIPEP family type III secretion protein [Actinobacteria bacterium]|nr:MAG: FHIPEP family type III secretion protein [Actinomycetota bacterium]